MRENGDLRALGMYLACGEIPRDGVLLALLSGQLVQAIGLRPDDELVDALSALKVMPDIAHGSLARVVMWEAEGGLAGRGWC